MQNLMVMFTFSFLIRNTLFGQIWSKNQNCQFKLKLGTCTNSNMQNLMVILTFSNLTRDTFLGKFGPKKLKSSV